VVVKAGAPAVFHAHKRSANYADEPVILDNDDSDDAGAGDKAEGASGDVDTGCIKQDASLYDTFTTSELASEQHGASSAPA
jgi:hypothetical protein